ncbi:polysaccharide biosynthesis/export family protein [Cyanobium sp. ATX 6A2]|uniref:polysaccharide biosynthesis/export family protein n=1 Tax=Cyanobium sp. ATX 6A2 TaxID=2823700 RepID=UPI0020CD521A|nr:polysaccharide biosynthesis/export family protein [Cyanobium sp. ATX 6A2]
MLLTPVPLLAMQTGLSATAPPRSLAQAGMEREAFPLPEVDGREGQPALRDRAPSSNRMPGSRVPAPLLHGRSAEAVPAPAIATDPGIGTFRYRLGPGDRLRMSVFMVEGYAADVEVLADGTVNLPRLGSVPVWGLTLDEARQRITEGYDRFLRNPLVYLDLLAPRPVRVTLLGEVQKPGFYTLTQGGQAATLAAAGPAASGTTIATAGWPTLVDAVQRAGGITAVADLADVVLTRPSPVPGGGRSVEYRFDYQQLLMNNRRTVNPLLYDGDMVRVARAEVPKPSDVLIRTAASNFAPDTIGVTVVGEVRVPGLKQVRSNSPLAAAVIAAGDVDPSRANAREIRLIRVQPTGEVEVRTIAFDPSAALDSPANPSLHNGDMVVVPRNGWTRFNDFLLQAVTPFGPVLNAASLYRIFDN